METFPISNISTSFMKLSSENEIFYYKSKNLKGEIDTMFT